MDKLVTREGRNTKFAYILFFYGIVFIPFMLINFRHGTRGPENFPAYIFSGLFSLVCAILLYSLHLKIKFNSRFLLFMLFITIINIFIWIVLCEGTFDYKERLG